LFSLFTKIPPQFLPHHALSRFGGLIATLQTPKIKNWIINDFIQRYHVNMQEAERETAEQYQHFQDFFARHLKPGVRTIDPDTKTLVSPVDGRISEFGKIENGTLLQAKGRDYSLQSLLGSQHASDPLSQAFLGGEFMTIYLAPPDYHRIHMPFPGKLIETRYIPGRLFSVNPKSVNKVDALFARNERLVAIFDTDLGKMAVIMVGAMLVASISTVWQGLVTPPHRSQSEYRSISENLFFNKGAELGHFNLGSTVILLFQQDAMRWHQDMQPNRVMRLGEGIGKV